MLAGPAAGAGLVGAGAAAAAAAAAAAEPPGEGGGPSATIVSIEPFKECVDSCDLITRHKQ